MDLLNVSLVLSGLAILVGVIYKFVYEPKRAKALGNAIRILLFEQIGKDVVYIGSLVGEEKPDVQLGVYIRLGKNDEKVISDVANSDLFYDKKYGKCLLVCKYADDDYRVMARLNSFDWFKKVIRQRPILNKDGSSKVDAETGKDLFEDYESLEPYNEPIGISQEGREVMRFNREFHSRMAERRKEKATFWDKFGAYIMLGSMMLIILMSTAYNSNKFTEAAEHMANAFGDKADEYINKIESPSFIETLLQKVESRANPTPPT